MCDNESTNMNALGHLESECPKLFTVGCVARLSDLVVEDVFDTIEAEHIKKTISVAIFVKSHCKVKNRINSHG